MIEAQGIRHGELSGYATDRCRCDACRDAYCTYRRNYRAGVRLRAEKATQPKAVPHGTLNGYYRHECRCDECRAASAASARERRYRNGGSPKKVVPVLCTIEGCGKPYAARGWCAMHYARWRTYGDTGEAALKTAPAGAGCVTAEGYRIVARKLQHRQVMEEFLGRPLLKSESVHHRNGDRLDNRIENLELWSKSQPAGQRVIDKVAWAREILATYEGIEPQLRLF